MYRLTVVGGASRNLGGIPTPWLWIAGLSKPDPICMWLTKPDRKMYVEGWELLIDTEFLKVRERNGIFQFYIHESLLQ